MARNGNKIVIASSILLALSIVAYIYGFSINQPHIYEWAREAGGAGLAGVSIGIISKIL
tara:strand:+ start:323 stop:499 length:177 start_codon:yes stop_codon:yes gene_type:complete